MVSELILDPGVGSVLFSRVRGVCPFCPIIPRHNENIVSAWKCLSHPTWEEVPHTK